MSVMDLWGDTAIPMPQPWTQASSQAVWGEMSSLVPRKGNVASAASVKKGTVL